jgi:hypothetical protein
MEEEDHIHSTQLPLPIAALAAAAQGSRAAALGSPFFFLSSHIFLSILLLFIDFNGSISCSFVNNGGHSLSMVGANSLIIPSCHQ